MSKRWTGLASALVVAALVAGCAAPNGTDDDDIWSPRTRNDASNEAKKTDSPEKPGVEPAVAKVTGAGAAEPKADKPAKPAIPAVVGPAKSDKAPEPAVAVAKPAKADKPKAEPAKAPKPQASPVADLTWVSRALPTGDRGTSALMLELGAPREVNLGAAYTFMIKARNLTGGSLESVCVTDKLIGGKFTVREASPKGKTTGDTTTWDLGGLSAGQMKTISVTGVAGSKDAIVHCVDATWKSVLCATTMVVRPALDLVAVGTKSAAESEAVEYAFTVRNSGTGEAKSVRVRVALPQGIETLSGSRVQEFNAGTIASGKSKVFKVRGKAKRGKYKVSATASGANLTAKSNVIDTHVTYAALALTHTGPKKAFFDRDVTYRLSVKNTGDGEAHEAAVSVPLPAGALFRSVSAGGKRKGASLAWALGTLAPGASKNLEYRVNVGRASLLKVVASATAKGVEKKTAAVESKVGGIAAIMMEVVDLEDPIAVGSNVTYVITITNQGTAADQDVLLQCEMEPAMKFVSARGASEHSVRGRAIEFTPVKSLGPKQKVSWTVSIRATDEGDMRFKTRVTSRSKKRPITETEATNFYK